MRYHVLIYDSASTAMSRIGTVTTKLSKTINLVLAASVPNWVRISSVTEQVYKQKAVAKIQRAVISDKLSKTKTCKGLHKFL